MIRIGTRKSKLALIQTELVKAQILKNFPNEKIEVVHVVTHGDKILDKPLGEIGGKGVFTKEIEEKLLDVIYTKFLGSVGNALSMVTCAAGDNALGGFFRC